MLAKPRAARGPDAVHAIDGRGSTPQIGVVIGYPPIGEVIGFGDAVAADRKVLDHVEQRPGAFREIAYFGAPIIHLLVDVERHLAIPRGNRNVVPFSLQIQRLRAGARTGDHQITPHLKVESQELREEPDRSPASSIGELESDRAHLVLIVITPRRRKQKDDKHRSLSARTKR